MHKKMKFPIKNFFSKCDQICIKLRIWSHFLKKFLMENFIFCAVHFLTKYFTEDLDTYWEPWQTILNVWQSSEYIPETPNNISR